MYVLEYRGYISEKVLKDIIDVVSEGDKNFDVIKGVVNTKKYQLLGEFDSNTKRMFKKLHEIYNKRDIKKHLLKII